LAGMASISTQDKKDATSFFYADTIFSFFAACYRSNQLNASLLYFDFSKAERMKGAKT
jgi:hypothetical protein